MSQSTEGGWGEAMTPPYRPLGLVGWSHEPGWKLGSKLGGTLSQDLSSVLVEEGPPGGWGPCAAYQLPEGAEGSRSSDDGG